MARRGLRLTLAALVAGIVVGVGILTLERYIGQELVGLLQGEVAASCGGSFKVDSIEVSLLTLRARAHGARIEIAGSPRFGFQEIQARFGLERISERVVEITQLRLIDGFSEGVGPDSATFQFVDYLAEPLPPERDRPDRWRIKLKRLSVINSRFEEQIGNSRLIGAGTHLLYDRLSENELILKPRVRSVRFYPDRDKAQAYELGGIAARLNISDEIVRIEKLSALLGDSRLDTTAQIKNKAPFDLDGKIDLAIDARSLELPETLDFTVEGEGTVGGRIDDPAIEMEFNLAQGERFVVRDGPEELVALTTLDSSFAYTTNGLVCSELSASNSDLRLESTAPFEIVSADFQAPFRVSIDSLDLGTLKLSGGELTVSLDGELADPNLSLSGTFESVNVEGRSFAPVDLTLSGSSKMLTVQMDHDSTATGRLKVSGTVPIDQAGELDLAFEADRLQVNATTPNSPSGSANPVRLSGAGKVSGPPEWSKLAGSAEIVLSSKHFEGEAALRGKATIRSGRVQADVTNQSKSISASLTYPYEPSQGFLQIRLDEFQPSEYDPEIECVRVSIDTSYQFPASEPLRGAGEVVVTKLEVGCDPYRTFLKEPATIPITQGVIDVEALTLFGPDTSMTASGTFDLNDDLDFRIQGALELHSLLGLLPEIDDLRGLASATLHIYGPPTEPVVNGAASITNAELGIEAASVSASSVGGDIRLAGGNLVVQSLQGSLNGGFFELSGAIFPNDLSGSTLVLTAHDILVEPSPEITLVLSPEVTLVEGPSGRPTLEGTIKVDSGEFRREIDLVTLLKALTKAIFSETRSESSIRNRLGVDLDLELTADRNLFVYTNWLGAELRADLLLTGDLATPALKGKLETVSGWFGLRNRRFDITSGAVVFEPTAAVPALDLIAETYVLGRTGDNTLVLLEARGPITDPDIRLESDRGLSQQELLRLVTGGARRSLSTQINTIGQQITIDERAPLLEDLSELNLTGFVENLASIDDLAIEPAFNEQRGVVEPAALATKRITKNMSLVGETFLGSTAEQSELRLEYDLNPKVNLSGSATTIPTRNNTALGADLTYTILASQLQFLSIEFKNFSGIPRDELLKAVRLTTNTRLQPDAVEGVSAALREYLQSKGYFQATVSGSCKDDGLYCRKLTLSGNEGPLSKVGATQVVGDDIAFLPRSRAILADSIGQTASTTLRDEVERSLVRALRNEGYIGSRVTARYRPNGAGPDLMLELEVAVGNPVSFVFEGNSQFRPEDFLATINLFERKQPFGNNTIKILISNIEQLYRESGYVFVTISYQEEVDPESDRITYRIDITEENPVEVTDVVFEGGSGLPEEKLRSIVRDELVDSADIYLEPRFPIAEEIEAFESLLENIYIDAGYPDVEVNHELRFSESGRTAEIAYRIVEGDELKADWLTIVGFPEELEMPAEPTPPYSVPRANRYVNDLVEALRARGYLSAEVWSELDPDSGFLTVHVESGEATRINRIELVHSGNVKDEVILENLLLNVGDTWDRQALDAGRRNLLKLGMFSRVDLRAADGELNDTEETLLVRLTARPLQTLEVGGGLNSEFGVHVFGAASDRSLFRDGKSLDLRVDTYYDRAAAEVSQGVASLRFTEPDFFLEDYTFSEDLRFQKLDLTTQEFDLDRVSLSTTLARDFGEKGSLYFGHTIFQENLDNVSPDAILGEFDQGTVNLSFLTGGFTLDRRDHPLNPRRGFVVSLDSKVASEALGSDAQYALVSGRSGLLVPIDFLNPRVSIALGAAAGNAWAGAGTSDIPISQRFYLGGRSSVRGFRENSLGPRGDDGSVLGGDLFFSTNTELRYQALDSAAVHLFFDAGAVYLQERSVDLDDVRESIGIGVRYISPIGPIGFDLGHPLDARANERQFRLHFSIGTIF